MHLLFHISMMLRLIGRDGGWELTPFKAAFDAALACLEPLVGLAAPVKTYASAIALVSEELAISAAAGAYPSLHPPIIGISHDFLQSQISIEVIDIENRRAVH